MKQTLKVLGNKMNWDNELEIKDPSEFGMDVIIHLKDGMISIRHNCTEFHHRYERMGEPCSAMESDIHGTGGTVELSRVKMITVLDSTKKHEHHWGITENLDVVF